MEKFVLASGNQRKCDEIRAVLGEHGELATLASMGIESPEETGATFIENAIIKARHAATHAGLPALADDSGLVVPALNGEPGIHSARYAGAGATDAANNRKLLQKLAHCKDRSAFFYCCLVYLDGPFDPTPLIAEARWRGQVLHQERGQGGFGYDPIFRPEGMDVSAAELGSDEKNRLSHRARALAILMEKLSTEKPPAKRPRH